MAEKQTVPTSIRVVRSERTRVLPGLLALFSAGLLVAFLVVPLSLAIGSGFLHDGRISAYWLGRVVSNEFLVGQLGQSLTLACFTTIVCTVIAVPLAVLRVRCQFRGQGLLGMAILAPMILPPFVGALAMKRLFSQFGVLNLLLERVGLLDFSSSLPPDWLGSGFPGVVLLQVLHLFPILYLNASAALANVDPSYVQAGRTFGAGPLRAFLRITLPLIRPGLFAGGTIVFIWSFTDVGTPLILGYEDLIPVTIFKELARADTGGRTYSLVLIMLSSSVTLYVLGKFLFGRAVSAESAKASTSADTRRLGWLGTLGAWLLFGGVLFLALAPHLGVALTAVSGRWVNTVLPTSYTFRHLSFVVTHPATYRSVLNSLRYAGTSTLLDIVFGFLIAWLVVRAQVRGRSILDGLAMLPLAIPGLILASGYVALTASGPLAAIGPTRNPFLILVIAYTVRRIPLVVRGVSAGLQQVPASLEEAARTFGATQRLAILRVTLPLIMANVIAASLLTFAFAMLEVSDSLILAQTEQYFPITKQIYNLATSTGSPETPSQAAALGLYGMGLLGGTMALASILLGRRLGAIFRA